MALAELDLLSLSPYWERVASPEAYLNLANVLDEDLNLLRAMASFLLVLSAARPLSPGLLELNCPPFPLPGF